MDLLIEKQCNRTWAHPRVNIYIGSEIENETLQTRGVIQLHFKILIIPRHTLGRHFETGLKAKLVLSDNFVFQRLVNCVRVGGSWPIHEELELTCLHVG